MPLNGSFTKLRWHSGYAVLTGKRSSTQAPNSLSAAGTACNQQTRWTDALKQATYTLQPNLKTIKEVKSYRHKRSWQLASYTVNAGSAA